MTQLPTPDQVLRPSSFLGLNDILFKLSQIEKKNFNMFKAHDHSSCF